MDHLYLLRKASTKPDQAQLAPRDAEARATLARAYLQAGLKAKAKRELDVVLELQKDHKFAKSQLKQFRWWNLA